MDILIIMVFAPADCRSHKATANYRRCQRLNGQQNPAPALSRRSAAKAEAAAKTEKIIGVRANPVIQTRSFLASCTSKMSRKAEEVLP
jgi:hypothetical protein